MAPSGPRATDHRVPHWQEFRPSMWKEHAEEAERVHERVVQIIDRVETSGVVHAAIAAAASVCLLVGLVAAVPRANPSMPPIDAAPDPVAPSIAAEQPTETREPVAAPAQDQASPTTDDGAPSSSAARSRALVAPDGQSSAVAADPPKRRAAAPAPASSARGRFEQRFPKHAAAEQHNWDPATQRWAVLIGINEHSGRTRDNLGSRQDAEALAAHLLGRGWRRDHVLLLTDADATRENIIEAIRWLDRKTSDTSVSVFHYSGHTKQWHGWDKDGDGETTDEALWPSDNRHITDGEFAGLMRPIRGRLWIDIGACEAAGYLDPGVTGPGRIVTFSSREDEKSYEDPKVGHSIWGWELIVTGMQKGSADANGDRDVTVEEAVTFAVPRAAKRTQNQRYGPQNGSVNDQVDGQFSLRIPPKPEPEPTPEPTPQPDPCSGICLPGTED